MGERLGEVGEVQAGSLYNIVCLIFQRTCPAMCFPKCDVNVTFRSG